MSRDGEPKQMTLVLPDDAIAWQAAWDHIATLTEADLDAYEFWGEGENERQILERDLIELRTLLDVGLPDAVVSHLSIGGQSALVITEVIASDEDVLHRFYRLDVTGVLAVAGFRDSD
jgi:succinylarginine dihydrolase